MTEFLLSNEELIKIREITKSPKRGLQHPLLGRRKEEMKMLRFDEMWSMQKIANRFSISRERVRQIIGNNGPNHGGFQYHKTLKLENPEYRQKLSDLTIGEIANKFDVSKGRVSHLMLDIRNPISGNCALAVADKWEEWASVKLTENGISNDLMTSRHHPFDILALDFIRIDVKVCSSPNIPPSMRGKIKSPRWSIHTQSGKKRDDCDFYMFILGEIQEIFIIPSIKIPRKQGWVVFCYPTKRPELSKWIKYKDAYSLILEFYNTGYIRDI